MAEPLSPVTETVRPEWIDSFGHLNMAYYLLAFDSGTYAFWGYVTRDRPQAEQRVMAYAVVEAHINYLREVVVGKTLSIATQLLDSDAKRFRLFHEMHVVEDGYLAATNEVMGLGFNLETRSLTPFAAPVRAEIERVRRLHAGLPMPRQAGRAIAIPRKG